MLIIYYAQTNKKVNTILHLQLTHQDEKSYNKKVMNPIKTFRRN